jgi:excisionase family DNA binding protein
MTTKEIADILSVNKITVRRLIKSGQLRAIRVNRSIRVPENSFQEYIRHGLGIADNEIEDNLCDDMEKVSTAQSLLKLAGTWAGDDAEKVLNHILETRSRAEF